MRRMPLLPASRFFHASSTVLPQAQIMPSPVTTTRRVKVRPLGSWRVPPPRSYARSREAQHRRNGLCWRKRRMPRKLFRALSVLLDVIDSVVDGPDLFRVLVGNLDVESFFEGHDQLDGVERIGAQVVYERGAGGH